MLRWLRRNPKPQGPTGVALEATGVEDADPRVHVLHSLVLELLADRRHERRTRLLRLGLYALVVLLPALIYLGTWLRSQGGWQSLWPGADAVGVVRIEGELMADAAASAERVIPALRRAFESPSVRAVVVAIDSPGGAPQEAERIARALGLLRQSHPKPVVAVIGNQGASAAYLLALHCDRIYAGRYSVVGSIGAMLAGWDAHQLLARAGVAQRLFASGELKSMMNPFLPMSPAADAKARELVTQIGDVFKADVELHRGLRGNAELFSGAVWMGSQAHGLGLVDEIATLDEVMAKRWRDLPVQDFGPRASFGGFGSASAEWFGRVAARVLGQGVAVR